MDERAIEFVMLYSGAHLITAIRLCLLSRRFYLIRKRIHIPAVLEDLSKI